MRKYTFTLLLSMLTLGAFAQLVNDGATITIKPGATLFVETNVSNSATGTINIEGNGILEIQGNLTNAVGGNLNTSPTSKVKFSGALASTLDAGNDSIANLELAKTAAVNVTLMTNDLVIKNELNFNGLGKLVATGRTLTYMGAATTTGFSPTEYIVTGPDAAAGTGTVKKNYPANVTLNATNGAFTFHVGDAVSYSPLATTVSGTSPLTPQASVSVRANDIPATSLTAGTTDSLTRYWDVDHANIASYSNAVTGTYVTADDVVGTAANIKGASREAAGAWNHLDAATNGTSTVSGTIASTNATAMSDFTGMNFFGKVNAKAYLAGNYLTATNDMSTLLNAPTGTNWLETSALTSPYNVAPYNASPASVSAGFFLANPDIVDWIMLELRDPASPSVATTNRSSAFLKKDGSIVGLDGTSVPTVKGGFPTSVVAFHHRNHIMFRTKNLGVNTITPPSLDLRSDTTQIYRNLALANTPLRLSEAAPNGPGGLAAWTMWAGDSNQNGAVAYNGSANDRLKVLAKVGGATPNNTVPGYFPEDCNLNGITAYNGSANDRLIILANVGAATPNNIINKHE